MTAAHRFGEERPSSHAILCLDGDAQRACTLVVVAEVAAGIQSSDCVCAMCPCIGHQRQMVVNYLNENFNQFSIVAMIFCVAVFTAV